MPITPFHFGPGVAIKALIPRHFSLTAFCLAQVVTDVEVVYYILSGASPIHRFFHTYLGATAVGCCCGLMGQPVRRLALRLWHETFYSRVKNPLVFPERISTLSAFAGAFLGTYSHVLLDSIYGLSYSVLHLLCVILGLIGLWFYRSRTTFGEGA